MGEDEKKNEGDENGVASKANNGRRERDDVEANTTLPARPPPRGKIRLPKHLST